MGLAQILLAYIEAFLGWLLHSFRGRDAKLFTRSAAFKNVPQTIKVTSGLGASGRTVFPIQYTAAGQSAWPPLLWGSLPANTVEVLVIVQDPDAPLPSPIVHSCLYGIPAEFKSLTEGDVKDTSVHPTKVRSPRYKVAQAYHPRIYSGPRPVLEHGPHRYFFQVVALAKSIRDVWSQPPTVTEIAKAVEGDIVGWGEWVGTYERRLKGALIQPASGASS